MNHQAIVAKVSRVEAIPNADRIHVAYVLGEPVVVSKDVGVGYVGVFFPVDVQLSAEYCHENNLYRDSSRNKDQSKKGFFEDNRRVRSQPFLKVKSCGYFATLDSVNFTGGSVFNEKNGHSFDTLNGVEICKKYISEATKIAMQRAQSNQTKFKLVDYPMFDKHSSTDNFRHFAMNIRKGSLLSFHNKRHGTSMRVGKLQSSIKLEGWKAFVNKFLPVFPEKGEYEMVVGSRNVTLKDQNKEGFHGTESFRFEVAKKIYPFLEDGMTVFGEIVGFVNGKPIMPNGNVEALKDKRYTTKYGKTNVFHYGCNEGECGFHIYMITRETTGGKNVAMGQKEMEQWCFDRGLGSNFEVHPQMVYDGNEDALRELVEELTERPNELGADWEFPNMIGEGIIVRVDSDNFKPKFFKSKSYPFRVLEGLIELDDMETLG